MGLDGRIYIDGGGTSRQLEVEVGVSGRERWGSHDLTTHEKLDAAIAALVALNTAVTTSVSDPITHDKLDAVVTAIAALDGTGGSGTGGSGTVSDSTTHDKLDAVVAAIADLNTDLTTVLTTSVSDPTTHDKLDAVVTALADLTAALTTGGSTGGSGGSTSGNSYLEASATGTVGTTLVTVATFDCRSYKRLSLLIRNTGAIALNQLKVAFKYKESDTFKVRYDTSADYQTTVYQGIPEMMLIDASLPTLTTMAGGTEGWLEFNVERVGFIAVQATTQANSTSLEISSILKA